MEEYNILMFENMILLFSITGWKLKQTKLLNSHTLVFVLLFLWKQVFEKESSLDQLSFNDARAECRKIGGDLASFQSKEEENYLVNNYIPMYETNHSVFLKKMISFNSLMAAPFVKASAL